MEEEVEDTTLGPGWIMMTFLFGLIDLIEFISVLLNLTGWWIVLIIIINLFAIFLFFGWRTMTEGFSFSAIFGTWKQVLLLLVDQVPVIGDFFPGLLLFMLGIRKKKVPKPTP